MRCRRHLPDCIRFGRSVKHSIRGLDADFGTFKGLVFEHYSCVQALLTIIYAIVHTVFSLKQKVWTSRQATSTVKKTDYVAIRIVVSLCVLWLLTTGWNMIMVARRPVCLPEQQDLQRWESGFTCYIARVGTGFAAIAL